MRVSPQTRLGVWELAVRVKCIKPITAVSIDEWEPLISGPSHVNQLIHGDHQYPHGMGIHLILSGTDHSRV